MKFTVFLFVTLLACIKLYAQDPEQQQAGTEPQRQAPSEPGLFGKVVDSKTNKGIDAASVQVFLIRRDSATGKQTDSLVAGMLTRPNGDFGFRGLSVADSLSVRVTATGYTDNNKIVSPHAAPTSRTVDMGNVKLGAVSDLLSAVTVVAEPPALRMGIDRKVFNVDKSITSTGGTAVDVMRNIPSVTVDVEGNVLLRNSSPQIFVDGRPTILTLQQIPADDIERIELITNPSAKFDASSSGGIINVVLKKNKRFGINGLASAGIGTPGILNGNLSLNLRQGKVNFFASGNYNQSGGLARGEAYRQNKNDGVITDYFDQQSKTDRDRRFRSIRFGMDYFIDNRNTVSISQNFVNGRFKNLENQDQQYYNSEHVLNQLGQRISDGNNAFNRSNTQLNYSHDFAKPGRELTADVTYNSGGGYSSSLISNYFFSPDGVSSGDPNVVRNRGDNTNNQLTVQADFVNPISENSKVEMGLRSYMEDNTNVFNAFSQNNNNEIKLPLSTNVRYSEKVHAAYTTYTNKWKGIRFQAGLRAEYTQFNGTLVDSAQSFGYTLPTNIGNVFDGLFPSLYLTREVGEGKEMQLNFSRRIRRPNFWQLNPFLDIDDPLNISQGNPQLRPEYSNSFEFNYNQQYGSGNFLAVLYFRNNDDDITRFSDTITAEQFKRLNNAAIEPNAILNTFINAQYTNRMGAELTVNHRFGNLELIPNINLQYRDVKARVGNLDLSNQGFNWETKLIVNYKLESESAIFDKTNFQLTGNYESPEVIPQGRNKSQFVTDFALRKEFLKNNTAALTFAVNDVFNTNRWGQIYDTDNFYQDAYRRWNVRNFRLTLSYRFGKSDFNMFGNRQRSGANSGGNDDD